MEDSKKNAEEEKIVPLNEDLNKHEHDEVSYRKVQQSQTNQN